MRHKRELCISSTVLFVQLTVYSKWRITQCCAEDTFPPDHIVDLEEAHNGLGSETNITVDPVYFLHRVIRDVKGNINQKLSEGIHETFGKKIYGCQYIKGV